MLAKNPILTTFVEQQLVLLVVDVLLVPPGANATYATIPATTSRATIPRTSASLDLGFKGANLGCNY